MNYFGKPRYGVPAPRFDLFIKKLEIATAKMQEDWRKIESLQNHYNTVTEVLTNANLKNDVKVDLDPDYVKIEIKILYEDLWEKYQNLIEQLGNALHSRGLVRKAEAFGFFDPTRDLQVFSWRDFKSNGKYSDMKMIYLKMQFPVDGTKEYVINRTTEKVTYTYDIEKICLVKRCGMEQFGSSSGS